VLLERVFANLLSNAVRHNRAAVKRVEIGALPGPGAPGVYVKDNGIGIDERHHERVFQIFARVSTEPGTGIGLGLALVKNIVESHGGAVTLRSVPGEGSTFELRFPGAAPAGAVRVRAREGSQELVAGG
jgi:signal transduction histidine kinase